MRSPRAPWSSATLWLFAVSLLTRDLWSNPGLSPVLLPFIDWRDGIRFGVGAAD